MIGSLVVLRYLPWSVRERRCHECDGVRDGPRGLARQCLCRVWGVPPRVCAFAH